MLHLLLHQLHNPPFPFIRLTGDGFRFFQKLSSEGFVSEAAGVDFHVHPSAIHGGPGAERPAGAGSDPAGRGQYGVDRTLTLRWFKSPDLNPVFSCLRHE